jgi:hypothetical protein
MHFTPLLLLAAGALAFNIPKGQPDGVYQVYTAPDGTETHTLLRGLNDTIETRSEVPGKFSLASKRQIGGVTNDVGCGGYTLPAGDTDAANNALDAQCGGGASGKSPPPRRSAKSPLLFACLQINSLSKKREKENTDF